MSSDGVELGCQSVCQLPNGAIVSANTELSGGRDDTLTSSLKVFNVDKNTFDANSGCLLGCNMGCNLDQNCSIF